MELQYREYQNKSISLLREQLTYTDNKPCLVLPTGAGKSIIIAMLCKQFLTDFPMSKVLILAHVQELLTQNKNKLLAVYPDAAIGIYSAGLKEKEINQITVAGIKSIFNNVESLGIIDLIIVDEAHLINHKKAGQYQALINYLIKLNDKAKVVGLTATPYRLGHGYITEGTDKILDTLIEPISVKELVVQGYLAPIVIPATKFNYDTDNIKISQGEYDKHELASFSEQDENNAKAVWEICLHGKDRKSWLIFCAGVAHAKAIAELLEEMDVPCGVVHGELSSEERNSVLDDFHNGKTRALVNNNVLTTGYDFPDIDLIALLRPTKSTGLYVQMVGRGMRIKSHCDDCLLLDFAGNVKRHGMPDDIKKPRPPGDGDGDAPVKECPSCHHIIHNAAMYCKYCGHSFRDPCPKCKTVPTNNNYTVCTQCGYAFEEFSLIQMIEEDIKKSQKAKEQNKESSPIKNESINAKVEYWSWDIQNSKASGIEMIVCTYTLIDSKPRKIKEYYCINHQGYAGQKGKEKLGDMLKRFSLDATDYETTIEMCFALNKEEPPKEIQYTTTGDGFQKIKKNIW